MKRSRKFSHLLAVFFAAAAAPALAQQAVDSWAPQESQAPIWLIVNDPIRGVIPFPPVHATLLPTGPYGRVMLFATTGINARAAWFEPAPIGDPLPTVLQLTPDHVPVDIDPPISYTDPVKHGAGHRAGEHPDRAAGALHALRAQ